MRCAHTHSTRRPPSTPPVELLTRGQVSPRALFLVAYVDEDASGELRYVEQQVSRPIQPTLPPAA